MLSAFIKFAEYFSKHSQHKQRRVKRSSLIIYSALIIAIFGLLYHLESPDPVPDSDVKHYLTRYEGKSGFSLLKVPDFLLDKFIQDGFGDSLIFRNSSFKEFRIMILNEKQGAFQTCRKTDSLFSALLDSLKFKPLLVKHYGDSAIKKVFRENDTRPWKEHVTIYASDSTFFLFNFITDMDQEQVKHFSDQLNAQNNF